MKKFDMTKREYMDLRNQRAKIVRDANPKPKKQKIVKPIRERMDIHNERARAKKQAMTNEERVLYNKERNTKRTNISPEQKQKERDIRIAQNKARRDLRTEEDRLLHLKKRSDRFQSLPELEKEALRVRSTITRANKRKSLSPEELEIKRTKRREKKKQKLKTDILFKLKEALRRRLHSAIRYNCKSGSAVKDLGCSVIDLKIYLENLFEPWMNWDNYGSYHAEKLTWNIDHIKPLASFNLEDREQLIKACHYTNLQPLLALTNLKKGKKIL